MERLALGRDFSRFLEEESFPHSVQVCIGDVQFTASGMVIAQQSSVLESKMKEENGVIVLDELVDVGTHAQKYDCFRFLYGAPISFGVDNIELCLKFSSIYSVEDMFAKALKWITMNMTCRNFHRYHRMSKQLSNSPFIKNFCSVITDFIMSNAFECANELMEVLISQQDVDVDCMAAVLMYTPKNGGALVSKWILNSENVPKFLCFSKNLDFVKLFPEQSNFTTFLSVITENSKSVETMKVVLDIQKEYFTALTREKVNMAGKPSSSTECGDDKSDAKSTTSKAKSKKAKTKKPADKPQKQDCQNKKGKNSVDDQTTNKKNADKGELSSEAKLQSGRKIVIKSFPEKVTKDEISKVFTNYGVVTSVKLVPPSGCAFVEFRSIKATRKIHNLVKTNKDAITVGGKPVHVVPSAIEPQPSFEELKANPEKKIFINNLPSDVTVPDIYFTFAIHGQLKEVMITENKLTAVLEFSTVKSAKKILSMFDNGHKFTILDACVSVSPTLFQ